MLGLLLSFVLSCIWVSAATILAEKLGTRVGGFLTTLPSTLIVALLFIGLDGGKMLAAEAAIIVPAEMGINAIFLAVFISLSRHGLTRAITGSMLAWFALSSLLFLADVSNLALSILIYLPLLFGAHIWLKRRHPHREISGSRVTYGPKEIAFRGVFAGLMIAVSIFLATVSGPTLGGIFSVFPAIFTSTMVILYLRQGQAFSGATGSTMVMGSSNVAFYSVCVFFFYPWWGLAFGTLACILASYMWALSAYMVYCRRTTST